MSRGTTHPPEIEALTRGVKGPFSREQRKPIPGPKGRPKGRRPELPEEAGHMLTLEAKPKPLK